MGGEDVEMTAAPIVFKKKKPSRRAPKPGKKKRQQFQSEDPRVSAQEPELETEGPAWTSLSHTALGRPVLFTPDGRFALVATGAAVKIYQADTCTLLSSLVPPSIAESSSPELFRKLFPRNSITALRFHPLNSMQLITASLDGFVRIWDYINGFLIKSLFVDASIVALASSSFQPEHLFLATAGQLALNKTKRSHRIATNGQHDSSIVRLSLKKFKEPKQLLLSKETMIDINISPDGQYLVAANVTHFYVLSLANPAIGWANFKTPNAIRCIAVHPSQPTLAVGDSRGMIRLYRPFDHNWWQAKQKAHEESAQPAVTSLRPSFSSMHWHAFGVVSLAFTLNGAMLLSGGEEGVLVQWQLSNGAKDFLPRLGAPVSSIHCSPLSPDSPSEAAVALVDGSILLTSIPDKKVMRTISGLKSDATIGEPSRRRTPADRPLITQPGTNYVVTLSSHPSAIQFYSLAQDKHIAELEVSRSNRVARRSGSTIEPVRVERLSFTPSAEWLVTFDTWHSSGFRLESTLKFWHQKSEKEPVDYLLFSSITNPHAEHNLVAVAFAPALSYSSQSSNRLLTVDVTGCLKLWSFLPGSRTSTDKQQPAWISTWEYNQQRDVAAHCAAWSPDGSLFAIGHSDAIAVWHAESLTCLHKFPLSASSGLPQSLSFSDDTLVAGCDGMSMGWSLLDFKEIFSFATTSGQVGSLSDTGLPITEERPGTQTGQLFSLHLGVTPGLTKTTLPLAPRKMTRVPTTITELPDAQIFMGHSGDIYAPADHLQRASTSARKLHAQSRKNQNKSSLFNDIFEGHKPPRSRKQQPVDSPYQPSSKTSPAAALSQPAHLMPPLTQLWQEAILLPPPRQPAAVTDPTADGSIPMDEDDVQDPVASALPDGDATQHQQTPLAARNITLHPAPAELLTGLARRL